MQNISTEVKGDKLIITCDVSKKVIENAPNSKSGKTKLVATTAGSVTISTPAGSLTLGMNLMSKG